MLVVLRIFEATTRTKKKEKEAETGPSATVKMVLTGSTFQCRRQNLTLLLRFFVLLPRSLLLL